MKNFLALVVAGIAAAALAVPGYATDAKTDAKADVKADAKPGGADAKADVKADAKADTSAGAGASSSDKPKKDAKAKKPADDKTK